MKAIKAKTDEELLERDDRDFITSDIPLQTKQKLLNPKMPSKKYSLSRDLLMRIDPFDPPQNLDSHIITEKNKEIEDILDKQINNRSPEENTKLKEFALQNPIFRGIFNEYGESVFNDVCKKIKKINFKKDDIIIKFSIFFISVVVRLLFYNFIRRSSCQN